ncbi:hexitol phosphatase HxpB [Marinomonas epiphytica]
MRAVIFDMDGTLIHSEPFWKLAEKEVFSSLGVKVTPSLAKKTATMTTREVTEFWYQNSPWLKPSLEEVESRVINRVAEHIANHGKPMDGAQRILNFFYEKGFKIGLATNAPSQLIPIVLESLDLTKYFSYVASSESEVAGKPHPAVYQTVLSELAVCSSNCIAFEDSLTGVKSAQAAGIKTVVVPAQAEYSDGKYDQADLKISSLTEFSNAHLERILPFC